MKRTRKATRWQYERGSIAVEAAIVIPILVVCLWLPSIVLAFYFRQYTAVKKAAHDAAIYLSEAPRMEITTAGSDGSFAALTLARRIIAKELAGVVPDGVPVNPLISCTYQVGASKTEQVKGCTPSTFNVATNTLFRFDVTIEVPYINPLTGQEVSALYISTATPVRYLGN